MRFTITPLGGAKRPLRQIVAGIVEYLAPKNPPAAGTTDNGGPPRPGGPSRYYADRGDEPGRWLGRGAADLELIGMVDREEFALVLSGRDPRTGVRLITAQGSAGRRPRLGVGTETRWDDDGEGIYDERDTTAALDLEPAEIGELLDLGARLAAARLFEVLGTAFAPTNPAGSDDPDVPIRRSPVPGTLVAGSGIPDPLPSDAYLVPVIDADGHRWVTEAELVRFEDARAAGISPEDISAAGAPDDLLKLADAARLVGVTPRYLRGVARHYEDNQTLIDQLVAAGEQPRQAYLVAYRGTKNRWLVKRSDLADFVARRRPPAVRAGYDLTLTTEKSLSVLALLSDPATTRQVLDAIQEANDWALGWLEVHSAAARIKGETVPVDGWTVGSFRHLTSRALDPFAHWHNVVPNTVKASDGTRRALDARGLYRDAKAAGALATAQARWRITTRLGPAGGRDARPDGRSPASATVS